MNPKEVSYSHPQLPLCDTPIFNHFRPLAGIETQKYVFLDKMQELRKKKVEVYYPLLPFQCQKIRASQHFLIFSCWLTSSCKRL